MPPITTNAREITRIIMTLKVRYISDKHIQLHLDYIIRFNTISFVV